VGSCGSAFRKDFFMFPDNKHGWNSNVCWFVFVTTSKHMVVTQCDVYFLFTMTLSWVHNFCALILRTTNHSCSAEIVVNKIRFQLTPVYIHDCKWILESFWKHFQKFTISVITNTCGKCKYHFLNAELNSHWNEMLPKWGLSNVKRLDILMNK